MAKELPEEKIAKCITCGLDFVARLCTDDDEYGNITEQWYTDQCQLCVLKSCGMPDGVVQAISNYYNGLITQKELLKIMFPEPEIKL